MQFRIEKKEAFRVIGFERLFGNETAYAEIPKFWNEVCEKYAKNVYKGKEPANAYERATADNCIGEYGVCIDDMGEGCFRYLIAGKYSGGEVPDGMTIFELPQTDWAVFDCIGKIPDALQSVNARIWKEWLPQNKEYEMSHPVSVEWYDTEGNTDDDNYKSAIWVAVRKKKQI